MAHAFNELTEEGQRVRLLRRYIEIQQGLKDPKILSDVRLSLQNELTLVQWEMAQRNIVPPPMPPAAPQRTRL